MIELEKTFLAKYLPDLNGCKHKEIIDIYIPKDSTHPKLRLRKSGEKFEMTKKQPIAGDASEQEEQTIALNEKEFIALSSVKGKKVHKKRFYYRHGKNIAEIDVFQEGLKGLVLVDFEFKTVKEKKDFKMPNFCLEEVTHEDFIAGGRLCGKKYSDIAPDLKRCRYRKLV